MRHKITFFTLVIAVVVGSSCTTVQSTEYLTIPHSACLPKQEWSSTITQYHSNGASVQPYPNSGSQVFYCPIMLGQGAEIVTIKMEGGDSTGGEFGGYLSATLYRFIYNSASSLGTLNTGIEFSGGNVRKILSGLSVTIDNSQYHYGLGVYMNNPTTNAGNIFFSKFIIEYEPGTDYTMWDKDGDEAVSLPDAIHALQVVAGN